MLKCLSSGKNLITATDFKLNKSIQKTKNHIKLCRNQRFYCI